MRINKDNWQKHFDRQEKLGLSVTQYARMNGLSVRAMYAQKAKFHHKRDFVELKPAALKPAPNWQISIDASGQLQLVVSNYDDGLIKKLISCVQ